MSARTRRLLLSLVGSALVMGLGYFLNRTLDWDQLIAFFPTAWVTKILPSDAFGADTYPVPVQIGFLVFHVAFWAGVAYAILKAFDRTGTRSSGPEAPAGQGH